MGILAGSIHSKHQVQTGDGAGGEVLFTQTIETRDLGVDLSFENAETLQMRCADDQRPQGLD
jgi:hypothetical protein